MDVELVVADIAAVVSQKLGIVCHTFYCEPEPSVALVKFDDDDGLSFLEQDGATFEMPVCSLTVTLFASAADARGGIAALLARIKLLRTIRGAELHHGGRCPPIETVSGIRGVRESPALLAVECTLVPVHVTL